MSENLINDGLTVFFLPFTFFPSSFVWVIRGSFLLRSNIWPLCLQPCYCSYGNMALFYHGLNQTELALRHMSRALLLLSLSSGPDHPDVAATFINVAMMYQDIGKMNTALRYLQEALKKNERLLGEEHIQTAVCYHALAIAFNCMGAFKLSHQVCAFIGDMYICY